MKFLVQLISFGLLLIAIGMKAAKDGLKNFNLMIALDVLSQSKEAFKDFREKWTSLKNDWKEADFSSIGAEVRTSFTFLQDRDLEVLLEDITIALLNLVGGVLGILSVAKRFVAYFNTEDISNSPKLEK